MLHDALRAAVPLCLVVACASPATERASRAEETAEFDVEHYALDLEIDPAARTLRGSCRIRLWPTRAPIDEVELDLEGLRVDGVADVAGRALGFEQDEHGLRVSLREPVPPGEFAELVVRYSGKPSRGLYFAAERAGVATQVYTHGECVDARAWFPCQDEPWERATSELAVRVPQGWSVFAAGERLERRDEGSTTFERWRTTFPHPAYLETLVAGEFAVEHASWDGIPLTFAAAPRLAGELAATFAETDEVLAFLSRATGVRYPYPKYAQVAVDGFQYGGMENLSATTLVDTAVRDAAGLADSPSTGLVAHEAAHQWFGDLVTCADWSQAWLNEGFATYFAHLYTESARGRDAFLVEIDASRARWLARDRGANRRPIVHQGSGDPILGFFSGHVYEGAAVRLHHLRRLLGDEAFFRGVRAYLGENAGRGVVTDDVRRAFESASGRDLREHFERWFRSPGHPSLEVATAHDSTRRELAIDVRQTQDDAPFPCLVEVEIADEAGVRVEELELDGRSERFVLAQEKAPRWVRIDPFCALPAEIVEARTYGEWLAILADAPDAAGRKRAATFLGDRLRPANDGRLFQTLVTALTDAARRDPSPDVRRAILERLDPRDKSPEKGTLCERASHDPDPSVRAAAFRALEVCRDDSVVGDLARAEIARGESHAAVGAALGALARADAAHGYGRLVEELRARTPHGDREARVLAEIARLGDPRSIALMRETARDASLPDAQRRVAVAELAKRCADDADARADLLAALDTSAGALRRDVIGALGRAVATPEVRARLLELAKRATDGRERLAVERALLAET